MATNCSCGIKQQKLQYHCGGQIEAIMRAYIMIVALSVFAMNGGTRSGFLRSAVSRQSIKKLAALAQYR